MMVHQSKAYLSIEVGILEPMYPHFLDGPHVWCALCRVLTGRSRNRGGVFFVGIFLGLLAGFSLSAAVTSANPFRKLQVMASVIEQIDGAYVEAVDQDALVDAAITGMVQGLDPYSEFLDADAYRMLSGDTEGLFGGIGVEIDVRDGWLTVVGVLPGGPSSRVGL